MNNRIMAALFALTLCLCLFIGVVPVDAEAACSHPNTYVRTVQATSATCTQDGWAEYDVCDYCGSWLYASTKTPHTTLSKEALRTPATGHKFVQKSNGDKHWEECENTANWATCGEKRNEAVHTAEQKHDDTQHWTICTVCNKTLKAKANHDYEKVANADGETHSGKCKVCGFVEDAKYDHTPKVTVNSNGTHTVECDYCDYEVTEAHKDEDNTCWCDVTGCTAEVHDYTGWNNDKDTHISACKKCKKANPKGSFEAHKFVGFTANGDGSHSATCETCGYVSKDTLRCSASDKNGDHICDDCNGRVGHIYSQSYMATRTKRDATCAEVGYKVDHGECKVCGLRMNSAGKILSEEEAVTPKLAHEYEWYKTDAEKHWQYCVNWATCNAEDLNEAAHTFTWVKGTGSNVGRHYKGCEICGYVAATGEDCADVPGDGKCECKCGYKLSHDVSDLTLVEAKLETCTENGNIAHFLCEECDKTFISESSVLKEKADVTVKATGHKLEIVKTLSSQHLVKCTRTHAGTATSGPISDTCKYEAIIGHQDENGDCNCDLKDAAGVICNVPLHTHSYKYQRAVEATCETEGTAAYWYFTPCNRMFSDDTFQTEIEAPVTTGFADHDPGEWENNGENHVRRCNDCDEVVETEDHVDDVFDNICDVCDAPINLEARDGQAATCTDEGWEPYWINPLTQRKYSDAQGKNYIANVVKIAPLGHSYEGVNNGTAHKHVCQRTGCGHTLDVDYTNDDCFCDSCGYALPGHAPEFKPAKAATCETDGNRAYAKCCGKFYAVDGADVGEVVDFSKDLKIPAGQHTYNNQVVNDSKSGKHYAICTTCGYKDLREHALVTSDPRSGNWHQMLCECGKTIIENHYDKNGDNVCDDAGCKHDLSGKKPDVNEHDNKTVVTGEPSKTNPLKNWLTNWMTNTEPSTGGGSSKPEDTAQPGTSGSGSQSGSGSGSQSGGSGSGSQGSGSDSGSGNGGSTPSTPTTPEETVTLVQQLLSFLNWILSGFGL